MISKRHTPPINKRSICYQIPRFAPVSDSRYNVSCLVVQEDPKLWYGIGILYDRYGSLDHAEEAFASVLKMDKGWSLFSFYLALLCTHLAELDFDKANEILFRLGIIYKQQGKYEESLSCFDRILRNPPSPLAHADIWFQIGHVYEQQKDVSFLCPRL